MTRQHVSGFGHSTVAVSDLVDVATEEDAADLLSSPAARGVIPRGMGRAYGDAAQNSGGTTASMVASSGRQAITVSPSGVITAPAGATIEDILRVIVPQGWFVPVTPGTARATLGGCIAADVHGKNHHCDGTFGRHVTGLTLVPPNGIAVGLGPGDEAFAATVSGMGLTGIVLDASFQAIPIETAHMTVTHRRTSGLDQTLHELRRADTRSRYSVAWLDLLARGMALGRGVIFAGDHAQLGDLDPKRRANPLAYDPAVRAGIPMRLPFNVLSRPGVSAFNRAYYQANRSSPEHLEGIAPFFHPLDAVRDWNRLYGRKGFVQYQFVVPDSVDGSRALVRAIEAINKSGYPGFLTVLKRFGPEGDGLLSFPTAGWTLTVDIPCGGVALRNLLRFLDDLVLGAGGRIYLAKDAAASPDAIKAMYPRLAEWQAIQARLDPNGVMQSDMSRRLRLTTPSQTEGSG